jgi:cyclic-di-GMP-binding protein
LPRHYPCHIQYPSILKHGKPVERQGRKITGLPDANISAPGQRDHQEIVMETSITQTPDFVNSKSGLNVKNALPTEAPSTGRCAMNFNLPATGNEQSPAFLNAADCAAWLVRAPLANASLAQPILLRQLSLLHRYALPPSDRFAILEALRRPVCEVQEDAAKTFAGRPLPFAPAEQGALERTLDLWHMQALGYLRCFAAMCDAENDRAGAMSALLAQRALAVFADWQVDLCRGEKLPDAAYWRKLHQIFSAVETLGIATVAVNDTMRHGSAQTSALAAYAECHLLSSASPYELPARHLAWIARWARRWGGKLSLLKAPPEDIRNRAVPLWVDLDSEHPASHAPQVAGNGRWLDTTELRKSLLARIALLEQGRAPAELQLGDDVTQPAAGQLLQRVLQRWCAGGAPRRETRQAASGACRLVAGFEAAHFQLSGRQPFRAPSRDDATLRREREEFETFGDRRHSTETNAAEDDSHIENWQVMDDWRVLNESATGLCIARPLREGVRIGAGMLIAIKAPGSQRFALANVRWALRGADDSLLAGIQLFAGEPRPVAIRCVDPGEKADAWREGFLLPEIAALRQPASLVVPAGTFRLDRRVEVMADYNTQVLKLFRVLDRGVEFERCNLYVPD